MANLRAKYPQYNSIDDTALAKMVVAKYPQYKDAFSQYLTPPPQTAPQPQTANPVVSALQQPGQTLQSAASDLTRGNIVGGLAQGGTAGLQAFTAPFAAADAAVRQIPVVGPLVSNMARSPFALLNNAAEGIQAGLDALGVSKNAQNLGMTPENAQKVNTLVQNTTPLVAAPLIGSAVKAGAEVPVRVGKALEQNALDRAQLEFNRAVPPRGNDVNRAETLKRAQPYIKQAEQADPITSRDDGVSATRKTYDMLQGAAQNIFNKIRSQVGTHAGETFDLTPIGQSVAESIPSTMTRFDPTQAKAIQELAQRYSGEVTVQDAFNEIQRLNAETKSYERAAPEKQYEMRQNRPTLDAEIQIRDALREAMLNKLEGLGVKDAAELRKDYGAVASLRDAVFKRINPAENQLRQGGKGFLPSGVSDLGATILGEVALKVSKANPQGLVVGGAMGLLNRALREARRIDPTLERAIRGMGNSPLVSQPRTAYAEPDATRP